MKRIAFVAPPFAGHLNPLLTLAVAARDADYEVTVTTGARKVAAVQTLGLAANQIQSIGPDSLESIADTATRVGGNPAKLLAQFRDNLALLPAIRDELRDTWRQCPPHLVVADSVAPVAGFVCTELGIPWITTIATPFTIENRRGVPAYCGGWRPGFPLRDAAGRLAIRSFKRAVAWKFRREFAGLGATLPYRPDGTESIYSPTAILGFGISELEFPRDWPACFRMIGPAIDCPDSGPPSTFPAAARRVLVSVGTHLQWAKRSLPEDVAVLAAGFPDVQFVVSLGGANAEVREQSANVAVYPFVPYARDLAQFDAVIHHGGAGITYAAILHGIPSIAVPHDYDQFDFAARIEHHHLGRRARSIANCAPALRQVLDTPSWPQLTKMRDAARRYRPAEAFLETVNEIV